MKKAKVKSSDIKIEIKSTGKRKVLIKVSARQYMLPKPEVAEGILYQLSGKLK